MQRSQQQLLVERGVHAMDEGGHLVVRVEVRDRIGAREDLDEEGRLVWDSCHRPCAPR